MKNVEFYVTLLNDKLVSMNKDMEYRVTHSCGSKVLELRGPNGRLKWDRHGLTTGEVFEIVHSMYEMLARF